MPGIIGGLVSAIAVSLVTDKTGFPSGYFPAATPAVIDLAGKTLTETNFQPQALVQFYSTLITVLMALATGNLFGWFCKF